MASQFAPPVWVESGAEEANGLDLLALRAPAMRIGNHLLDGVTTITPSIRYLTFVSWTTFKYWERGGKDSRKSYLEFARRLEAAIVLGNLAVARDTTGLVGVDTAMAALDAGGAVPLAIDVGALAANAYSGPAEQLHLLETRPDATVPHLTDARGIPLARQLDDRLRATALGRRLSDAALPETATREELTEFGDGVRLRELPQEERRLLLDALMPPAPTSAQESRRVASYAAVLMCSGPGYGLRGKNRLLDEGVRKAAGLPPCLSPILDGWLRYLVRDLLAVVHEYSFRALQDALPRREDGLPEYLSAADAVAETLRVGAPSLEVVLRDLGVLARDEAWSSLSFADLEARVRELTSVGETVEGGLRRWSSGLDESTIISAARQTGAAVPGLLPVAWLLVERRVAAGISSGRPEFRDLSHEGTARLGVEQVITRKLASFRRASATFQEAAAELLSLSVEQHLRTAWSRLAVEGKDVAVILSDGPRWAYRKSLAPGRTNSRLGQVDNWFRQLGLLDDEGLTAEGQDQLARVLGSLTAASA